VVGDELDATRRIDDAGASLTTGIPQLIASSRNTSGTAGSIQSQLPWNKAVGLAVAGGDVDMDTTTGLTAAGPQETSKAAVMSTANIFFTRLDYILGGL